MKKIILLFTVSISIISCSDQNDIARDRIEAHIDSFSNDASSYEFVRMEKPDTLRKSATLRTDSFWINKYKYWVSYYEGEVNYYSNYYSREIKGEYGYIFDSYNMNVKNLNEYREDLEKEVQLVKSNQKLYNEIYNTPKDSILTITYGLSFRIKNLVGGLILTKANIEFDQVNQTWGKVKIENPLKGLSNLLEE